MVSGAELEDVEDVLFFSAGVVCECINFTSGPYTRNKQHKTIGLRLGHGEHL